MELSEIISYKGTADLAGITPGSNQTTFLHGKLRTTFVDYMVRINDTRTPSLMIWRFFAGEEGWKRYVVEQAWKQTIEAVGDWQNHVSYAKNDTIY